MCIRDSPCATLTPETRLTVVRMRRGSVNMYLSHEGLFGVSLMHLFSLSLLYSYHTLSAVAPTLLCAVLLRSKTPCCILTDCDQRYHVLYPYSLISLPSTLYTTDAAAVAPAVPTPLFMPAQNVRVAVLLL